MEANELNNPLLKTEDEHHRLLNQRNQFTEEEVELKIEDKMRNGFITKVFGILLFQISITGLLILPSVISSSYQQFQQTHYYLVFFALMLSIVLVLCPLCCGFILQRVPLNYIYLFAFTLCFGYSVSYITSGYSASVVLFAVALTLVTVATLTVYASRTKSDITVYGGVLYVCLMLIIFGSLLTWVFHIPLFELLLTVLSLVLFSIYLVYDIQLLLGNKQKKFSEDDYILAAMNIYLDVMNIFLEILNLLGQFKGD